MRHAKEAELALFVTGDLNLWRQARVRLHVANCETCRERAEIYREDRQRLKDAASEMPPGVDWERLAAEMAANIHVGLAAGECVAPRKKRLSHLQAASQAAWGAIAWGPMRWGIPAAAGVTLLIGAALWLNFPSQDKEVLGRAMGQLFHTRIYPDREDPGPVVEASSAGIELRENGGTVRISQGALRPVAVSVNAQGSASARYVDADTGQVTITSVYVQ